MGSYLSPSIARNNFHFIFTHFLLVSASILLFIPCRGISAEDVHNKTVSQFPELNYSEGEITIAQVEFDGIKRDFRYYVPNDFNKNKKHPLILVLHGYNQPIDTIVSGYSSMHLKADKDGTIIIYPVATGSMEKKNLAWNTKYGSLGNAGKVDDIGYL